MAVRPYRLLPRGCASWIKEALLGKQYKGPLRMFTQEIGNIPPGEELIVEVSVDQRLRWLDEGAWEWRFPTVVAPRYLGEPGREAADPWRCLMLLHWSLAISAAQFRSVCC